jgi:hypothetical protein
MFREKTNFRKRIYCCSGRRAGAFAAAAEKGDVHLLAAAH